MGRRRRRGAGLEFEMDQHQTMQPQNVDYMDEVRRLFRQAPFIADLGLSLAAIAPGRCETTLDLQARHLQQDGVVHAGVMATMADHTSGTAGASLIAKGAYVLTAEFKINFLQAARGDRLCCVGQVLKPGRRLIVAESEVFCHSANGNQMVAKAMVTLAVVRPGP